MVMTLTNTETELEEVKCDVGDRAMILPQNDPSPVRLHDMVKRNRKSRYCAIYSLSKGLSGQLGAFCEIHVYVGYI